MKRSGPIKRKTPIQARSELKAKTPMNRKREKRSAPKCKASDTRWRSAAYLAWVRQRHCVFCGLIPCDPHHVIGLGWGLSGMGLKAPDSFVMPLCRRHHEMTHRSPALQDQQPTWLRWTIMAALESRNSGLDSEICKALREALAFIEEKERAA